MAKRKKAASRKKQTRRKSPTRRAARPQRTRLTAALERAQKTLTQEVLTSALSDLSTRTTMGEMVSSLRSAGFAKDFEAMSLKAFIGAVGGAGVSSATGGKAKKGGRKAGGRRASKKINTRTDAGREALDKAVSGYLQANKTARAEDIRGAVGGTSAQVRQSLARLMAAKKVSKKGQKRSTEYSWR